MLFNLNMITKNKEKMMYLISIGVNKDCEDYDAIWSELIRRMNAVSIPIVRVDWLLYDDENRPCDLSKSCFMHRHLKQGWGL